MNNYIYILTDSNRSSLHVGMVDDLKNVPKTYRDLTGLFLDDYSTVFRLVYHEALPTFAAALRRLQELNGYTRMQKERLIRKHNPNWLDLGIPQSGHKPSECAGRIRLTITNPAQS